MPIFLLVDALLARPKVARYLFDRFRTRENLRTVLQARSAAKIERKVHKNPSSVVMRPSLICRKQSSLRHVDLCFYVVTNQTCRDASRLSSP